MTLPLTVRHLGGNLPPSTRTIRSRLLRYRAASVLLVLAACGPPTASKQPSAGSGQAAAALTAAPPDTAALVRDLPRLLRLSEVPGLSMAVVEHGNVVWTRAFGTVNDSARTPVDTATVFEAASLSKPVFAYTVLRLADRGEFDLDRPLLQMLDYPRLAHDERAERITARIVLSHGTGLPNWGGDTLSLRFDPGTAYGYSGEGFVFLQKVVEHVTGHSLDQLARREVFEPLGMTRSSYVWQDRFAGDAAYAKDWLWRIAPAHRYTEGEANAAASLLTTAPDYARFVAAVVTGRGLSPGLWKAFLTPVRATGPGISIGLGVRIEDGPNGRRFYHSGNNGRRFTCYMTGDLATGLGLVYFTNAYNGTSLVAALASRVFGTAPPIRHWADFDRFDDPRLVASRSVQRAAVERGADAARDRLRAIGASPATRPTFDGTLELGAFLAGRGLARLAIEVLQRTAADAPDSAAAHLALGRAYESAGDLRSAVASYQRALALEGADGDARQQIRWTQQRLAVRARPVTVARQTLERYAGQYQEQAVTLRDGRLYFAGPTSPPSPLIPMAGNLFEVGADPAVRVRFVGGGTGSAVKLIAVYSDGTIDEWARSR